jgi:hypothetical protein
MTAPPAPPQLDAPMPSPEQLERTRADRAQAIRARVAALLPAPGKGLRAAVLERLRRWGELAAPVLDPIRRVAGCASTLGWLTLAAAVVGWLVGARLGWREGGYAAAALLALLACSALLVIGRTTLAVTLRVEPQRVIAGESAIAEVTVSNTGKGPVLPVPLDVPTGETITRFNLPALRPGGTHDDLVRLPSTRRGVYVIGPAKTLRGDPFGLVRREVTWTESIEFFVHPRTVYLDSLGSGLLKDLEGQTSNDVSMSDLAFHTLREYAPGDDRRHIHWLSSAKRSGASNVDQFMVRQFLDTRRSHIGVLVDCHEAAYATPDEFEVAVAAGASVAARALRDELDVTEASGQFLLVRPKRHVALDLFSRAELTTETIDSVAARMSRRSTNVSALILVTGSSCDILTLRRAGAQFSTDVTTVVLKTDLGADMTLRRSGGLTVITLPSLADLPRALAGRTSS